jgi:hypothetical protein
MPTTGLETSKNCGSKAGFRAVAIGRVTQARRPDNFTRLRDEPIPRDKI